MIQAGDPTGKDLRGRLFLSFASCRSLDLETSEVLNPSEVSRYTEMD
jgi:hypothetical protein